MYCLNDNSQGTAATTTLSDSMTAEMSETSLNCIAQRLNVESTGDGGDAEAPASWHTLCSSPVSTVRCQQGTVVSAMSRP